MVEPGFTLYQSFIEGRYGILTLWWDAVKGGAAGGALKRHIKLKRSVIL